MNIIKPDSPVMNFLSTIADLIIINLLFIICSLPIVTFGAAYSAKYYVAMKIIRGEGSGVIIPFFKAFKRNFKQATGVWLIMLVGIALIILDWRWVILNGWGNTPFVYKLGVVAMSVFVWLMMLTLFPTISRYEMKTSELFKAALMFVIIKFIPLILITALMIGSVVACIWYTQWFPLIYVFTSTTITYFLSMVFIKQFDKLEAGQAKMAEEKAAQTEGEQGSEESETEETETEENEETIETLEETPVEEPVASSVAAVDGNISYAQSKKDIKELEAELQKPREVEEEDKSGNKLTRYIRRERKKLKGLTGKQKLVYFAQYYLPATILIILVIAGIAWYGHDIYVSKMRVLSGGLVNCQVSDEGRDYATKGFLEWGDYGKARTAVLLDTDLNFESDFDYNDRYLDVAFRASILTGAYDYLIMREDAIYNYSTLDYLEDMSMIVNMDNFSEDDFYIYEEEEAEKAADLAAGGKSIQEILDAAKKEEEARGPVPVALKLTDDIEKKLGLDEEYTYYIAFAYSTGSMKSETDAKFVQYLFGKS